MKHFRFILCVLLFAVPGLLSAQCDLAVMQIVHPVGDVCPDDSATLKCMILNNGENPVTFSVANPLTVQAAVTGTNLGVYTRTIQTGSLAPGAIMLVTIPGIDLSDTGSFTTLFSLTFNGDGNTDNNSLSAEANTSSLAPAVPLPYNEVFIPMGIEAPVFEWQVYSSHASYQWQCGVGASPHASAGNGPMHDHTSEGTPLESYGGYAMVVGANGTQNYSKWAALLSPCMSFSPQNGYPVQVSFYKYLPTPVGNQNYELILEVGSGSDFTPVDTLTPENAYDDWEQYQALVQNFFTVGRLRFLVTHHIGTIDLAVDDIAVQAGCPDPDLVGIVYPEDNSELHLGDTFHVVTAITNNSPVTFHEFQINYKLGFGVNVLDTTETFILDVNPGDTVLITSNILFQIPADALSYLFECKATIVTDCDALIYNNSKRVILHINMDNLGIDEVEDSGLQAVVLPNPARGEAALRYRLPESSDAELCIRSVQGREMMRRRLPGETGENRFTMDIAGFPAGLYLYTLTSCGRTFTGKLFVAH